MIISRPFRKAAAHLCPFFNSRYSHLLKRARNNLWRAGVTSACTTFYGWKSTSSATSTDPGSAAGMSISTTMSSDGARKTLGCDLEVELSNDGFMKICIHSSSSSSPPQIDKSISKESFNIATDSNNNNKRGIDNESKRANVDTNTNLTKDKDTDDAEKCIPETVLQYERQIRKNQAAKRASAPLSKSQLHVIHNDEHIIVTSKPSGVLTVPGINSNPSLLSLLYDAYNNEIEHGMIMEHMIIHRLDMDTSGLVIFAKNKQSMSKLQKSFRDRDVTKEYEALVCGHLSNDIQSGCIDLPLQRDHRFPPFMRVATPESEKQAQIVVKDLNHAGWKKIVKKKAKSSQTLFHVVSREYVRDADIESVEGSDNDNTNDKEHDRIFPVTRLQLIPVTGRTHQLRVHCAAIGHPILGDPTYGIMGEASPNGGFDHQTIKKMMPSRATNQLQLDLDKHVKKLSKCMCLHARKLGLAHPVSGKEMSFEKLPEF